MHTDPESRCTDDTWGELPLSKVTGCISLVLVLDAIVRCDGHTVQANADLKQGHLISLQGGAAPSRDTCRTIPEP